MLAVVPDNQDESRRGVHLRAPSGNMSVSGKAEVGQSVCTDISISMLRGIRMSSESTTTANLQACWRTCRPSSSEWLLRYFAVRASGPKCAIAPAHSFDRTTDGPFERNAAATDQRQILFVPKPGLSWHVLDPTAIVALPTDALRRVVRVAVL